MYPHFHPCILISSCLCVLVCNLISSHHFILRLIYFVCLLVSLHPDIHISLGACTQDACWYRRIITSSYLQVYVPSLAYLHVRVCLLATSYSHIPLSLGSCTLYACWYHCILTSSYPQVHVFQVLFGILKSSSSYPLMALTNFKQNNSFITKKPIASCEVVTTAAVILF